MKSLLALVVLMVGVSSANAELVRRTIQCDSNNYNPATCAIDLFDARLDIVNQTSRKTTCREYTNYSIDRNYVNVWGGCRANFVFVGVTRNVRPTDVVLRGGGHGGGGPGWGGPGGGYGGPGRGGYGGGRR